MLICGVKVSHDGGVALIEDNRLIFSVEIEKLNNGHRYSRLGDLDIVREILERENVDIRDIDRFVVDGWCTEDADDFDLGSTEPCVLRSNYRGEPTALRAAPYQDRPGVRAPLHRYSFDDHDFGESAGYTSYHHVSNHLIGAYTSSPFAQRGEDSFVLVWDGGTAPRLYQVAAETRTVHFLATLMPITGGAFSDFCLQFDPFRTNPEGLSTDVLMRQGLSTAGKAMAYAALGRVEESAFSVFDEFLASFHDLSPHNAKRIAEKVAANRQELFPGLTDADLIATFQAYLGNTLLTRLSTVLRRLRGRGMSSPAKRGEPRPNLALAGGCALNIKWNSAIRRSGLFEEVWIPPFPNDSGAAIGTASCEMFGEGGHLAMDWDVHSGPRVAVGTLPAAWTATPCDERQVAELLHTQGEPVIVLSGRAEIGPRALGNRSILAPATDAAMKDRLNKIKNRAGYRPVAPICLTSRAAEVFSPGGSDRYMLFEHTPRREWAERIPAVIHLDGTARLQTIDESHNSATGRILAAYERLSGIPVLCNTSANFNGKGFFPDVSSAAAWGGARCIWSEGVLYTDSRIRAEAPFPENTVN